MAHELPAPRRIYVGVGSTCTTEIAAADGALVGSPVIDPT